MKIKGRKLYLFIGLTVFLLVADQLTKLWARHHVQGQAPTIYWNDFFRFEYAENTGAFLSLGAGLSETWRFLIFTLLTGLFLGYSLYYLIKKDLTTMGQLGFVLIISGGIGNLIDRATFGYVVDFMNMGIGSYVRTGIFNIADMAIVAGILILFLVKDPPAPVKSPEKARKEVKSSSSRGM